MTSALNIIAGDTVSYSGLVILPSGTWTATCVAERAGEQFEFDVDLTLVGLHTSETDKYDWAIVLSAPATRTTAWVAEGEIKKTAVARIRFTDASPTPVVTTSNQFAVTIYEAPPA